MKGGPYALPPSLQLQVNKQVVVVRVPPTPPRSKSSRSAPHRSPSSRRTPSVAGSSKRSAASARSRSRSSRRAASSERSDVDDYPVPDNILGYPVKYEIKRAGGGGPPTAGLSVQCPNEAHGGHSKWRSLHLRVGEHGVRSAEYFLGAWLTNSHSSLDEHRKAPSVADINAYAAHRAELDKA